MKKIIILMILFCGIFACEDSLLWAGMDFSSPQATFQAYMEACRKKSFAQSDQCYTKEFQSFIKTDQRYQSHRHVGQLSNEYRYLHDKPYRLEMYGDKAIMRFSSGFRRPAPLYFIQENGQWKIDGMFSFNNIIMESSQNWYWRNSGIDNEALWLQGR